MKPIPTLLKGRLYKGDSLHIFHSQNTVGINEYTSKFLEGRSHQALPTTTMYP